MTLRLGEYLPAFQRCVVLSFTQSSTASQDVECLIPMEALRYLETSGNVYRPTSKGNGKFHPRIGHEGTEVKWYSSTLSLTSALDAVGGQLNAPAALAPRKPRCSLYRRLGGPQTCCCQLRKISPAPPGFDLRTVQVVASRFTNSAIPAP